MDHASCKESYEKAVLDNERLLATVGAIDTHWPGAERAAAGDRRALLAELTSLRTQLRRHFDTEEQSGYLAEALSVAPRLAHSAEALLRQHAELAAALDRLIAAAETSEDVETLMQQHQAFRRWTSSLRDHEQAENALMLEAFDRDIGSGD